MKNSTLIFIVLSVITSCSTLRSGKSKLVEVKGTISVEQPICEAGKAPQRGENAPVANAVYYIKKGETNSQEVIAEKELKTDENGAFTLYLSPGTYSIIHADKMMSQAEFRLKHSSQSSYMKDRDEDCFTRWYTSPDFLLKVENDTTVAYVIKSRCYTKMNPCIEYTGPR